MSIRQYVFALVIAVHPSFAATLRDAFSAALERNEAIGQSQEMVERSEEQIAQLRAGLFPNIGFGVTHQIQPEPADPVARQFSPGQQTTITLTASQPLFRGGRAIAGLQQVQSGRDAAVHQDTFNRVQLFQELANVYIGTLTLEQDLKNLREQVSIYANRMEELKLRSDRGESNRSEWLSAKASHASLVAEVRMLENNLFSSRQTLAYLTGQDAATVLVDPRPVSNDLLPSKIDPFLEAVVARPDIRAAQEKLEAARKGVTVAWGAHLPSVDAVGNYYLQRPGFLQDLKWDVGIRLTVPIFQGGGIQSHIRQAVSFRKDAELELEKLRRKAKLDVQTAFEKLQARREHLAHLKHSTELSKQSSDLLQQEYRRGLTRNIDVQMALGEFWRAQRGLDQSRYAIQMEWIQLEISSGQLPKEMQAKN